MQRDALGKWNFLKGSGKPVSDWATFWASYKADNRTLLTKSTVPPVETSDEAEAKSSSDQSQMELQTSSTSAAAEHENIALNARRDSLRSRKNMLCTKIATDIRLMSDIESIPDWIARVSKDIPAWRDDLEHIESEIVKVDAESKILGDLHNHNRRLIELSRVEDELIRRLESIQVDYKSTELLIDTCANQLDSLRGLPIGDSTRYLNLPLPIVKILPPNKLNQWDTDGSIDIYWQPWSDGIEIARDPIISMVYAGYGRCTKCNSRIEGGEFHTCKPTDCVIQHPPLNQQNQIQQPRLSVTSATAQPTAVARECPQHDAFMSIGQEHYCTSAPVETSGCASCRTSVAGEVCNFTSD